VRLGSTSRIHDPGLQPPPVTNRKYLPPETERPNRRKLPSDAFVHLLNFMATRTSMGVVQSVIQRNITWSLDIDLPREAQEQACKVGIHFDESIRDRN
jgi:hypothetical protein